MPPLLSRHCQRYSRTLENAPPQQVGFDTRLYCCKAFFSHEDTRISSERKSNQTKERGDLSGLVLSNTFDAGRMFDVAELRYSGP